MKRSKISLVLVAGVLGVSLAPRTCEGAEHDLRTGTFQGNWCGFDAQFEITKERKNDAWTFDGKILIKATGQYDKMTVVQNADNSLRIVRHLSGARSGTNQWVDTYPPETVRSNGKYYVRFTVKSAGGYGSKRLGHLQMLRIP